MPSTRTTRCTTPTPGSSWTRRRACRIAAALGPHKAVILRNHGLLTVGDSVDAAAWWFLTMERACQVQLLARAAGKPMLISHRDAVTTRDHLGSDLVAWINYQPLWQRIVRTF